MSKNQQAPTPPPAPDASFLAEPRTVGAPTLTAVAERTFAQDQAQAIARQLGERDAAYAQMYGMALEEWQAMPPRAKELVLQSAPPGYVPVGERNFETGLPEVDARSGNAATLASAFDRLRSQLISPEEEKEFVFLCDPVVTDPRWGRRTPGISKIRRDPTGQSIAKKIRQGFTYSPMAEFYPEPSVPCGFPGLLEPICPYRGYPDQDDPRRSTEVEIHQKAKHPREYAAREAAALRQARETERQDKAEEREERRLEREALMLQIEAMRRELEAARARKDDGA